MTTLMVSLLDLAFHAAFLVSLVAVLAYVAARLWAEICIRSSWSPCDRGLGSRLAGNRDKPGHDVPYTGSPMTRNSNPRMCLTGAKLYP